MRRRGAVIIGIVGILLLAVLWRCKNPQDVPQLLSPSKPAIGVNTSARDLKKLPRGTISGSIIGARKQPISYAHVCATAANAALDPTALREPLCTNSDAHGNFAFENLLPAAYTVGASARGLRPATVDTRIDGNRIRVELVLYDGGVELSGVVLDVTGGPIARARVSAGGASAESDSKGEFSLWVARSNVDVLARAEGYADRMTWATPPQRMRIIMTPEGTLAGVVVDASSQDPVTDARVLVRLVGQGGIANPAPDEVLTDSEGKFVVRGLIPGRYTTVSRTDHGYGRSEVSALVGIGERVDGVIVKLHPAVRLDGKVLFASSGEQCVDARVALSDRAKAREHVFRRDLNGALWADGVLPGKYTVRVDCGGAVTRDDYPPIVVAERDIGGLVWEIDRGGTIEGRIVVGTTEEPVSDAYVAAFSPAVDGGWKGRTISRGDGSFRISGLRSGRYVLRVWNDEVVRHDGTAPIQVTAGAIARHGHVVSRPRVSQGRC